MSNDHEKQKFRTQIGIEATVQRSKESSKIGGIANHKLNEIGESMNPAPDNLEYVGSAAMHIYKNETLGQIYFVNQTGNPLKKCPETVAITATKNFIGDIMERFGQKRPTLRSGF